MSEVPNISTKTGDGGETSLWSGGRVKKNHPSIKCVGELDLFDSAIGLLYKDLNNKTIINILNKVQSRLVQLKGEIATHPIEWDNFKKTFDSIKQKDVDYLDAKCLKIKEKLEASDYEITGWIQYGSEGSLSAQFDYVRGLCRKCEVSIYDLEEALLNASISVYIKQYINRLSDLLYYIGRFLRE